MSARRSQQGMAVIAALIIVALVATVAAGIAMRQSATLRMVQSEQVRARAQWMARDALSQAINRLHEDAMSEPQTHLEGVWHWPMRLGGEGAATPSTVLRITDEQAGFNLRSLVKDGRIDPQEMATFRRLCAFLQVEPTIPNVITARMLDALPGATTAQAQRLAMRPLPRDIDDLAGTAINSAALNKLRPHVTILPEPTWTNANTTNATIFAASVPGMRIEQVESLLHERDRGQWFINTGDIANRLQRKNAFDQQIHLGIVSHWFRVEGVVSLDGQKIPFRALVRRAIHARHRPELMWMQVGA